MKQEIQEIPIEKIKRDTTQPREHFDKEQLKSLSDSIKSSGLMSPIILREVPGNLYIIVAGERRKVASEMAGLKTIPAIVKSYKNENDWMIDSLAENIHREDLSPVEKAKYFKKIMDIKGFSTMKQLADAINLSPDAVSSQLTLLKDEYIMKLVEDKKLPSSQAQTILDMEDKETARKVAKIASEREMGRTELREMVKSLTKSAPEVKEALLNGKINSAQASKITNLPSEKERKHAIVEHSAIKHVSDNIEENIKRHTAQSGKKEFDKRLVQAKQWIASFRGAVTDSRSQLEKTFKVLLVATKFTPLMDDKQKERLKMDLDRFLETLEKSQQIAEKIEEHIK